MLLDGSVRVQQLLFWLWSGRTGDLTQTLCTCPLNHFVFGFYDSGPDCPTARNPRSYPIDTDAAGKFCESSGQPRMPLGPPSQLLYRHRRGVKTTWTLLVLRFMGAYSLTLIVFVSLSTCICVSRYLGALRRRRRRRRCSAVLGCVRLR